ncbi:hypothetical protein [Agromyces sp. Root81]|uniref:hypothetical protein n=1 Tax=Agromyces sp. Root81 TaxID=1736601 RepID=UPI0009E9C9E7|nr:hypothetical protein [Agromyces sp. Root81]
MALTTSLAGRGRNTNLPKSHALVPLLEAVVNAIQAIDARPADTVDSGEPGRIVVESIIDDELGQKWRDGDAW